MKKTGTAPPGTAQATVKAKHDPGSRIQDLERQLRQATARADRAEKLLEMRTAELLYVRRKDQSSFQSRVHADVFRVIEATGNATLFPFSLTPTLSAVANEVAESALKRRENRLRAVMRFCRRRGHEAHTAMPSA